MAANMGFQRSPRFSLDLLEAAVEAMTTAPPIWEEKEVMAVASFSLWRILLRSQQREVLPVMAPLVAASWYSSKQDQAAADRADPF